jgi:hypothetical protein
MAQSAQRYNLLYYVRPDGTPSGEVGLAQATQLMESGALNGNTFVWADGMDEWQKLCECKALFVVDMDDMKLHYETATSLPSDVVSVRQVRALLESGEVTADTLVWAEGMDEWARISECHAFFGIERGLVGGGGGGEDARALRPPEPVTGLPEPEPEPVAVPATADMSSRSSSPRVYAPATSSPPAQRASTPPKTYGTDWVCNQRLPLERGRVISSLEFDASGEFIAAGDTGGNVSIMRRQPGDKPGEVEFGPYLDFSAHEPEFDALKSVEISERVNCVRWAPKHRRGSTLLTSNGTNARPPTLVCRAPTPPPQNLFPPMCPG